MLDGDLRRGRPRAVADDQRARASGLDAAPGDRDTQALSARRRCRPGDAFLANDPYIVGVTHLNDCTVATPIFHDGRVVAFAAAVAHHSDVGGRVPGSEAGDNVSIYQEGIRVPPVQIYTAGKPRADVLEMFLLNSRMPHYGEGDLMAQMASCARGTARVQDLFAKYGHDTMLKCIDEMLDATERRMRSRHPRRAERGHLQRGRLARRGRRHRRAREARRHAHDQGRPPDARPVGLLAADRAAARTCRSRIPMRRLIFA